MAGAGWTEVSFSTSIAEGWGSIGLEIVGSTYIVSSYEGLKAWAEAAQSNPSLNCRLDANITLPAVEEGGSNWTPIPNFTGTFNGLYRTITGLTGEGGLFDTIGSEGKVLNLILEDVKITADGYSDVGAIAGTNQGTVSGCRVVGGSVQGNMGVGGIVGNNAGGSVVDCPCSATVYGDDCVGGIVGHVSGATANVVGCRSTGDVTGTGFVGGVVGQAEAGSVVCCGSTSNVVGSDLGIGGVAGVNGDACEVMYCCYSGDRISGLDGVGGVIGISEGGNVTACYWSGYEGNGIGNDASDSEAVTKVEEDGWPEAVAALNAAMEGSAYEESCEWRTNQGKPKIIVFGHFGD